MFEDHYKSRISVMPKARVEHYKKQSKDILAAYQPVPATDYISNEAKKTRLLIINEAHHIPRHRAFVETLLPDLYKLGYNFLGIETLGYRDTSLLQRKYPILISGTYSKEPCFGNFIRTAIQATYTLFPYEAKGEVTGKEREIAQAENIKKIMDEHPESKFLIYCGFDHAVEDSTNTPWILAMAGRLKSLTGIKPSDD